MTNHHLGLCLQVAFTAQSEAREAYERSVGDADGGGGRGGERGGDGEREAERCARCRGLALNNGTRCRRSRTSSRRRGNSRDRERCGG